MYIKTVNCNYKYVITCSMIINNWYHLYCIIDTICEVPWNVHVVALQPKQHTRVSGRCQVSVAVQHNPWGDWAPSYCSEHYSAGVHNLLIDFTPRGVKIKNYTWMYRDVHGCEMRLHNTQNTSVGYTSASVETQSLCLMGQWVLVVAWLWW